MPKNAILSLYVHVTNKMSEAKILYWTGPFMCLGKTLQGELHVHTGVQCLLRRNVCFKGWEGPKYGNCASREPICKDPIVTNVHGHLGNPHLFLSHTSILLSKVLRHKCVLSG